MPVHLGLERLKIVKVGIENAGKAFIFLEVIGINELMNKVPWYFTNLIVNEC